MRRYGGEIVSGEVVDAARDGDDFVVTLSDGSVVRARRLLVTTGLVDELPDIPGLRERWGRDVLHCPYCHGWEVRDQAIGVLATGPMSVHQAQLFRQCTADVTFFPHTAPPLTDEQAEELAARGIRVVDGEVVSLEISDDRLTGVCLADDTVVARKALAVGARMMARAGSMPGLGLHLADHPLGVGQHLVVDATGRTGVPGVWAAGNVVDLSAQVGGAAAAGAFAAAQINADLIGEEIEEAVAARRSRLTTSVGADVGAVVGADRES